MADDNRSGIHLTGRDSGWPVCGEAEQNDFSGYKSGDGWDDQQHATAYQDGVVLSGEFVRVVAILDGENGTAEPNSAFTFTLECDGVETANIIYGETAFALKEKLEDLPAIGEGGVNVEGGGFDYDNGGFKYLITFPGVENVPDLSANYAAPDWLGLVYCDVAQGSV